MNHKPLSSFVLGVLIATGVMITVPTNAEETITVFPNNFGRDHYVVRIETPTVLTEEYKIDDIKGEITRFEHIRDTAQIEIDRLRALKTKLETEIDRL